MLFCRHTQLSPTTIVDAHSEDVWHFGTLFDKALQIVTLVAILIHAVKLMRFASQYPVANIYHEKEDRCTILWKRLYLLDLVLAYILQQFIVISIDKWENFFFRETNLTKGLFCPRNLFFKSLIVC